MRLYLVEQDGIPNLVTRSTPTATPGYTNETQQHNLLTQIAKQKNKHKKQQITEKK